MTDAERRDQIWTELMDLLPGSHVYNSHDFESAAIDLILERDKRIEELEGSVVPVPTCVLWDEDGFDVSMEWHMGDHLTKIEVDNEKAEYFRFEDRKVVESKVMRCQK